MVRVKVANAIDDLVFCVVHEMADGGSRCHVGNVRFSGDETGDSKVIAVEI